jgi:octaprenyl-diphosphate synthase
MKKIDLTDAGFTSRIGKLDASLQEALDKAAAVYPEPSLMAPIRDLVARGGKRWRPLLMLLACEAAGGGEKALPLAPLVEFSHTASLMHDDIEDNSPERRGKPACHLLYGVDTALNAGSFLYFLASACVETANLPPPQKTAVYALWTEYLRRLHLGQAYDIAWHREPAFMPSIDDYFRMCGLKTGCLARFAAELGLLLAGSPPGAEELGQAAQDLGIGFQILDDVKNLTEGLPGKRRFDDFVEGKKSLPLLFFLQGNSTARQKLVVETFARAKIQGPDAPENSVLYNAMQDAGCVEAAETEGKRRITVAAAAFATAPAAWPGSPAAKALLAALPDALL